MKRFHIKAIAFLLFSMTSVLCDWQYRSRPDLAAPILNITRNSGEVTPGNILIAPFSGINKIGNEYGPRQSSPYIFTHDGELVWSGFTYFVGWTANFQASRYQGRDVLFSFEGVHNPGYGHGHGRVTLLDQNYQPIKHFRAGNHKLLDKHEFHIIDGKTALIQIYHPVPYDFPETSAAEDQQWIVDARFQEVDIETGEVLFEWSSLEHVSVKDSVFSVFKGEGGGGHNSSDAWDYFHINSVEKDEQGDYILSARNFASLFKIDGKTGDIKWKLGGLPGITSSDFTSDDKDLTFSFQHHARILQSSNDGSKQIISFFDNSAFGTEDTEDGVINYNEVSSAKIVEVDTNTWKAKLHYNGIAPDGILAKSQGSVQVLDNRNVFANWGSSGAITEFSPEAEPIFHAYLDSGKLGVGVENYRAFKANWTGYSSETIAVANEKNTEGSNEVYISWNGDTQTKVWKIFEASSDKGRFLTEAARKGFETEVKLGEGSYDHIYVEAYDDANKLLSTSEVVKSRRKILPYEKGVNKDDRKLDIFDYFTWKLKEQSLGIF